MKDSKLIEMLIEFAQSLRTNHGLFNYEEAEGWYYIYLKKRREKIIEISRKQLFDMLKDFEAESLEIDHFWRDAELRAGIDDYLKSLEDSEE